MPPAFECGGGVNYYHAFIIVLRVRATSCVSGCELRRSRRAGCRRSIRSRLFAAPNPVSYYGQTKLETDMTPEEWKSGSSKQRAQESKRLSVKFMRILEVVLLAILLVALYLTNS
jgi:hypothetical protein